MAYKKKTQPVEPVKEVVTPEDEAATFTAEMFNSIEPTTEYIVVEAYTAHINNKPLKAAVGDRVKLTPTQYNVLKRFVL